MKRRHLVSLLPILATCAGIAAPALAQSTPYPSKPVRMIVPFPPGGTTDVVARLVSQKVGAKWGQPIVVENVAGASGLIGTQAGVRAAPDGYVVTLGNNQTHATNAALFAKPGFDMIKDVQPVAFLVRTRHVIIVPANSPYRTLEELIAAGRTRPLNYASSSQGSASHLVSDALRVRTGIQATHIPYKGAAPAVADVVAGHVDFMTASYGSAVAFLQSGKVRGLAISGEKREPTFPDMPTLTELGYDALSADTWIALFAPAGTPRPIAEQWSDALAEFVAAPDVVEKLHTAGFDVSFKPLPEAESFHVKEVARWGKMVRDAGITMQ
ncbi:MAG: tripartite tricarboxylate transporter substrate binding protein [Burkholderiales bacterium]